MKKKKLKKTHSNEMLHNNLSFGIKEVDEEKYTIRGIFSTGDVDRHGEKIEQQGWRLEEYKKNPVILFAHDQWQPAVGKCVEIFINAAGQLEGVIQFAVEEYELAKTLFNLYKGGFMSAFSVGFRNEKYEVDQENDVIILKENTMFEISCVNVPANAMALAKSHGIDMSKIEELNVDEQDMTDEIIKQIVTGVKENIKQFLRTDSALKPKQVETPPRKGGAKKGFASAKQINKAIRQLVKTKQKLKK